MSGGVSVTVTCGPGQSLFAIATLPLHAATWSGPATVVWVHRLVRQPHLARTTATPGRNPPANVNPVDQAQDFSRVVCGLQAGLDYAPVAQRRVGGTRRRPYRDPRTVLSRARGQAPLPSSTTPVPAQGVSVFDAPPCGSRPLCHIRRWASPPCPGGIKFLWVRQG